MANSSCSSFFLLVSFSACESHFYHHFHPWSYPIHWSKMIVTWQRGQVNIRRVNLCQSRFTLWIHLVTSTNTRAMKCSNHTFFHIVWAILLLNERMRWFSMPRLSRNTHQQKIMFLFCSFASQLFKRLRNGKVLPIPTFLISNM